MMRRLLLVTVVLLSAGVLVWPQGLSPRAGAVSEGLYTNLYFGMNYKLPADWTVSFVAVDGSCERECVLLDLRGPAAKSRRAVTISAEPLDAVNGTERTARAGMELQQAGAKKTAPVREITVGGRKAYRADYTSKLVSGDVHYTIVMLPAKQYAVVFSFSSESRKHLDTLLDELPKAINFVGES